MMLVTLTRFAAELGRDGAPEVFSRYDFDGSALAGVGLFAVAMNVRPTITAAMIRAPMMKWQPRIGNGWLSRGLRGVHKISLLFF